jgi:hypothetical protein
MRKLFSTIADAFRGVLIKKTDCKYKLKNYDRVYLIHIRKTAGTSLNKMFLSISGGDSCLLYKRLAKAENNRINEGGFIFVGWNRFYINSGQYFYAFSPLPIHNLSLPRKTYTVTCFRDPVDRVISHYSMLRNYQKNGVCHPCMDVEGKWLGACFEDFIENVPKEHLLNQLFMFDKNFNVDAAIERVSRVSNIIFIDEFDSGVDRINSDLGLELKAIHVRKVEREFEVGDTTMQRLKSLLSLEYAFLSKVREIKGAI